MTDYSRKYINWYYFSVVGLQYLCNVNPLIPFLPRPLLTVGAQHCVVLVDSRYIALYVFIRCDTHSERVVLVAQGFIGTVDLSDD